MKEIDNLTEDENLRLINSLLPEATKNLPSNVVPSIEEYNKFSLKSSYSETETFSISNEQKIIPNPYKEVQIKIIGKDWKEGLLGSKYSDYIAKELKLSFDENVEISFNVHTEYDPLMELLNKKLGGEELVNFIGAVSTLSTSFSAVVKTLVKKGRLSEEEASQAISKYSLLPPGVRYKTTVADLPVWKDTGPLNVNAVTFKFSMGMAGLYDGRTEVYNPALALYYVNQPIRLGGSRLIGPMPMTGEYFGTLTASLASQVMTGFQNINKIGTVSMDTIVSNVLTESTKDLWDVATGPSAIGRISLKVGRFKFPEFVVRDSNISFSRETDTNGYPISATVTWSGIRSLETGYRNQIPFVGPTEK